MHKTFKFSWSPICEIDLYVFISLKFWTFRFRAGGNVEKRTGIRPWQGKRTGGGHSCELTGNDSDSKATMDLS